MEVLYIKKKKRRRVKKSVLLVVALVLLAALILTLVLTYFGGSVGTARYGAVEASQRVKAVVVRSETVVSGGEFEVAERFLSEGQQVSAGERVMDVYKLGYSREITMSLWRTRQDIYKAQLEVLGEARDVELRNYDNEVEALRHELSGAVLSGNTQRVLKMKDELTSLLADRSEYLRSTVQETETLRALYKLQQERETAVSDARLSLIAEKSGIVSYFFDDYSIALSADKLSTVTAELLDRIVKNTEKSLKWPRTANTGAYRIVDGGEWYLLFNTPSSQGMRVVPGEAYPIKLTGYGEFQGVAHSSFVSGGSVVNILKVNSAVGALLNARVVSAEIDYSFEGIRVEKRAVQFENGEPFVELMMDGKRTGVYVNVFAEDGGSAIVSAKNTSSAHLEEGVKYWIPKKRVFKK